MLKDIEADLQAERIELLQLAETIIKGIKSETKNPKETRMGDWDKSLVLDKTINQFSKRMLGYASLMKMYKGFSEEDKTLDTKQLEDFYGYGVSMAKAFTDYMGVRLKLMEPRYQSLEYYRSIIPMILNLKRCKSIFKKLNKKIK
jgi:hypothetical protein